MEGGQEEVNQLHS